MKSLQKSVAEFVRKNRLEADVAHRLLDVLSELGEVAKESLKGSSYGASKFTPTNAWKEELGDVLFSLICVANTTGVDLDATVRHALEKYERRIRKNGHAGSSKKKEPNKALEPTRTSVTSRAEPRLAPAVRVAHL